MEKETIEKLFKTFEEYVHVKENTEFWYARELQELLGYAQWKNFIKVLEKAKIACKNANQNIDDHFADVGKMIDIGKGGQREVEDIMLTRYACYLIAQNGDSRKLEISFAMTYFAVQTRKQEIIHKKFLEWERIQSREKLSISEKKLSGIIFERGVGRQGFARIKSKGDEVLFGGYSTQGMKNKLGIPKNRPLADFLPSVSIQAKNFANEITNFNLEKNENLAGEELITNEHAKNNQDVREVLIKNNIYPEQLPPKEDIEKIKRKLNAENKKLLKNNSKLEEK